MIVKLKGFIEDWFEDFVDLDVKGVVYRVFVPQKNINKISEKGSLVTFFIFEILKESERLFFGFSNKNDRELFSDLLKVQGVGGKMALNIMSSLDSEIHTTVNNYKKSRSFFFSIWSRCKISCENCK